MHEGHRARVRDRYEQEGLDAFSLHNVLEMVLFFVIPRGDTNPIAHRLVEKYHTLSAILEAPAEELAQIEGIGSNAASFLAMIPHLCRLYLTDLTMPQGDRFLNTTQIGNYLTSRLLGYDHEVVLLMLLGSSGKLRCCEKIGTGSLHSADLDMRKLLTLCAKYGGSRAILAHNHPDGLAFPSIEDMRTTERLIDILKTGGIRLEDHIIVSGTDFVSCAASNLMPKSEERTDSDTPS